MELGILIIIVLSIIAEIGYIIYRRSDAYGKRRESIHDHIDRSDYTESIDCSDYIPHLYDLSSYSDLDNETLIEYVNESKFAFLPILLQRYKDHENRFVFFEDLDPAIRYTRGFICCLRNFLGEGEHLLYKGFSTEKRFLDHSTYDFIYTTKAVYLDEDNSYQIDEKREYSQDYDRD